MGLVLVVLILGAMGAFRGFEESSKEALLTVISFILTVLILGSIIILLGSCMELIGLI